MFFKLNNYTPSSMLCKSLQMYQKKDGCSLGEYTCKGNLVLSRKQITYKLPGTKGSFLGAKRVLRPLFEPNSTHSYRQHHRCSLYKQRRRHEVGPSVCLSLENPDLVIQETGDSQCPTHSRPAECDSRPDHPDRVVSPSRGLPVDMHHLSPASSRPV